MKYLIAEDFAGHPVPFIFPDRVTHTDMREQLPYTKILSAGYILLRDGNIVCHGGDADVNAVAGPDDARIIEDCFAPSPAAPACSA